MDQRETKGGRRSEIACRFLDAHAAGNIEVNIVSPESDPTMCFQNGQNHREPAWIPTNNGAPGRAERCRCNQRLDFDQQWPGALDTGKHGSTRLAEIALRQKQL